MKNLELKTIEVEGKVIPTKDSRDVAEMMEVRHKHLLAKIDGINKDLLSHKIGLAKYWIESTYKDASGKENRNFQITKRGCEFLAHKTFGTKGNLFTDKYMDAFEYMEEQLKIGQEQKAIEGLNKMVEDMQKNLIEQKETIEEYKSMCKISCSKKRNYTDYIKKRLGITKANSEFEQVKARVFLILNISKWEDVELETSKNILNIIDESITVIKRERPYKQMSYFDEVIG